MRCWQEMIWKTAVFQSGKSCGSGDSACISVAYGRRSNGSGRKFPVFVKQLSKYKIPFEYHVYPFGKHGLSLATDEVAEPDKERFADPHVAVDKALRGVDG